MSSEGLARRGLTAVLQSYVANAVKALLQFAVGVLLARMLGPQEYGLVAVAWLVVGVSSLVMDIGLSSSIIQAEDIHPTDIAYVFYLQILIGLLLAALVFFGAPALGNGLSAKQATPLIQAMALTFVFKSFGQTSFALLNREMRFGALQSITVASYALGFGAVALGLAYLGFGAWSVIWGAIVQAGLATAAYLLLARPSLRVRGLRPPAELLRFGSKTVGANLLSWTIFNVDSILISRLLGPTALGLYSRALALANVPTIIVSSVQPLLFSTASRLQAQQSKIAKAFLAASTAVAMIMAPILIVTSVMSDEIITALYGDKWRAAAPLLAPLALAIIANAFTLLGGPLLMSINQTHREVRAQTITVVLMVFVVAVAAMLSIEAAAWAVLGVYILRMCLITRETIDSLEIRTIEYMGSIVPSLLLMPIPPLLAALVVRWFSRDWAVESQLFSIICGSAVGYGVALAVLGPRLAAGPLISLLIGSGRLPNIAVRWIQVLGGGGTVR